MAKGDWSSDEDEGEEEASRRNEGYEVVPASRSNLPAEVVDLILSHLFNPPTRPSPPSSTHQHSPSDGPPQNDFPTLAQRAALARAATLSRAFSRLARPRLFSSVSLDTSKDVKRFSDLLASSVQVPLLYPRPRVRLTTRCSLAVENPRTGGRSLFDCSPARLVLSLRLTLPLRPSTDASTFADDVCFIGDDLTSLANLTLVFTTNSPLPQTLLAALERFDCATTLTFVAHTRLDLINTVPLARSFTNTTSLRFIGPFGSSPQDHTLSSTKFHPELAHLTLNGCPLASQSFLYLARAFPPSTLTRLDLAGLSSVSDQAIIFLVKRHAETLKEVKVVRTTGMEKGTSSRRRIMSWSQEIAHLQPFHAPSGATPPGEPPLDGLPPGGQPLGAHPHDGPTPVESRPLGDAIVLLCRTLTRLRIGGPHSCTPSLLTHLPPTLKTLELVDVARIGDDRKQAWREGRSIRDIILAVAGETGDGPATGMRTAGGGGISGVEVLRWVCSLPDPTPQDHQDSGPGSGSGSGAAASGAGPSKGGPPTTSDLKNLVVECCPSWSLDHPTIFQDLADACRSKGITFIGEDVDSLASGSSSWGASR